MDTAHLSTALARALAHGAFDADPPLALFYHLGLFQAGIEALKAAFPSPTLHTIAVKANPLASILQEARRAGMGAECASRAELEHALRLGFPPATVFFDSPAKTVGEVRLALEHRVSINVDNLQELERLRALAVDRPPARAGLRINPQTGGGAIAATSTAMPASKFGIPLNEQRAEVIDAFRALPWLTGLHVHTGSQGCTLELMVEGVRLILELAGEIEAAAGRPIAWIDIGGGLPVDFHSDAPPRLGSYASLLRARAPGLFDRPIITELGRSLNARAGWAASRVEYVKEAGGRRMAVIHAGADLLLRDAYVPAEWSHRLSVHGPDGALKTGPLEPQDVVGPLCFAGDRIATDRLLPRIDAGDLVVVHDAGAYTLAMWSRYNSRQAPAVYGYRADDARDLELLKPAETVEEVLRFWGGAG